VSQELRIAVAHTPDDAPHPGRALRQRRVVVLFEIERGGRDGVTVRIFGREAEQLVETRLEFFGDHVLEGVRFGVHLVPRHPYDLREVELEEPVVTDHLDRFARAALREMPESNGKVIFQTDAAV